MTRDDIIKALEQEWRDRLAAAVAAEREACARVCDVLGNKLGMGREPDPNDCAASIRARGETK